MLHRQIYTHTCVHVLSPRRPLHKLTAACIHNSTVAMLKAERMTMRGVVGHCQQCCRASLLRYRRPSHCFSAGCCQSLHCAEGRRSRRQTSQLDFVRQLSNLPYVWHAMRRIYLVAIWARDMNRCCDLTCELQQKILASISASE